MADIKGGNILIVDDETENLRFLGQLLVARGYRVHVAESGEQALEVLEAIEGETRLDLILLDILMPGGLDGIAACRLIKARPATQGTPVIFLTAREDRAVSVRAFEAGGADYVLKPFDTEVLLARVRAHLTLGRLSRGLESALGERSRQLRDANKRLRRLALEISLVEERERRRLAAELHDSPMQKLNLAQMQIVSAARRRDAESDRLLEVGLELMREVMQELRSLQFDLSPPALHDEGLGAALGWLAADTTRRLGVAIKCVAAPSMPPLSTELSLRLFKSARELVYNLVKHARADQGRIDLAYHDGWVRLAVADNGQGFDAEALERLDAGGSGLSGMRERLGLWGGTLRVETTAGNTRVTIQAPLESPANL